MTDTEKLIAELGALQVPEMASHKERNAFAYGVRSCIDLIRKHQSGGVDEKHKTDLRRRIQGVWLSVNHPKGSGLCINDATAIIELLAPYLQSPCEGR